MSAVTKSRLVFQLRVSAARRGATRARTKGRHRSIARLSFGSCIAFTLTPALSPGERENCCPSVGESEVPGRFDHRALMRPLPEGKGRGVGEQGLRMAGGPNLWKPPYHNTSLRQEDFLISRSVRPASILDYLICPSWTCARHKNIWRGG